MEGAEEVGIHDTLSVSDSKTVFSQPGTWSSATIQWPAQKPHRENGMFTALLGSGAPHCVRKRGLHGLMPGRLLSLPSDCLVLALCSMTPHMLSPFVYFLLVFSTQIETAFTSLHTFPGTGLCIFPDSTREQLAANMLQLQAVEGVLSVSEFSESRA